MSADTQPQLDLALLARAAEAAGISLSDIGANETPWRTTLPPERATLWAAAVAELDTAAAEAMQMLHTPVSMALQLAINGEATFTPELVSELQIKRPDLHRQRRESAITEALAAMERDTQQRREARQVAAQATAAADAELRAQSREQTRRSLYSQNNANRGKWW